MSSHFKMASYLSALWRAHVVKLIAVSSLYWKHLLAESPHIESRQTWAAGVLEKVETLQAE